MPSIFPSFNEAVPLAVAVMFWEVLDVWPRDSAGNAIVGWRSRINDLVTPGGRHGFEAQAANPFVDFTL